ncbi:hypothetical protein C2I18_22775 [Paenibacillus sp. PK3_47]|uniref:hypothetical protein n=1 Tax=Paenibacillus sp. PK3_47 TaxID=2072642 RepID=UPI00201E0608|nr:hypothetical protein [Paenibacillus sp. PK3_47]UQZ36105.1 hypothetical protein C2I18_22775 [Paenibacillus sp. PK3_47]
MSSFCPNCPDQTIVDPPQTVYENYYHPQHVQVIHPVEIIRQHHCVPVYHHCVTYTVKDKMCTVSGLKKKSRKRK